MDSPKITVDQLLQIIGEQQVQLVIERGRSRALQLKLQEIEQAQAARIKKVRTPKIDGEKPVGQ